ncbi:hypothetical protein [Mangrovihabitans endophyticus]|nr:hypothetical protein [Mangrovihabitans endophyticus]
MRRVVPAVALVFGLVAGCLSVAGPAAAAPSDPPGRQWRVTADALTWQAAQPVPTGDAAVEFWAGDRLLGRAHTVDQRTYTLPRDGTEPLTDLQVRAAGRRLDQNAPRALHRGPAPHFPPQRPAHSVDPGKPGRYATVAGEYTLPGITLPGYPELVEMQALVVAPRGAHGRRPLALFLHGRHFTCYVNDEDFSAEWPCPEGAHAVPSYRGYRPAQELLASQGYVTVSISANGINAQDYLDEDGGAQARSSLIRRHLARWADWSGTRRAAAPAIVRAAPRADLSRVFLMGHSRGGEGVNRAAMDSLNPPPDAQDGYPGPVRWRIRGMLMIGPTIFGQNPAPDVPTATILPGCDGDVFDLQGEMYLDATRGVSRGKALHGALYVVGANHNFFNTEWTPGLAAAPAFDDFPTDLDDPLCAGGLPTRLTPAQQQRVGAVYIAAAARLFVAGDDRVRPLLDGSGVRASSAGPARVLNHAIGAARTPAVIPDRTLRVSGGGRLCEQVDPDPARSCLPPEKYSSLSPHFVPFGDLPDEPGRYAVAMTWSAPGQSTVIRPARPQQATGTLAMRIIVPPGSTGTRLDVVATDRRGRSADLGEVRLDGVPGSELVQRYWAQEVRVPLRGLTSVARLRLIPRSAQGSAWLVDAWGWHAGMPAPHQTALPRLDVGSIAVDEGDDGAHTVTVPVRVTGRGGGQVRVFVVDGLTLESRSWVATVRPGQHRIPVPITVQGNTRFGRDQVYAIGLKAIRGLQVGDFIGEADIRDDDPAPSFTVEPVADTVAEGGTLRWRFTLSAPADIEMYATGYVVAPDGPELSTTDVDPDWLFDVAYEFPEPSRPLSTLFLAPWTVIEPGTLTGEMTIPTITDNLPEPAEQIRLDLHGSGREIQDLGSVTGTVTDAT